MNKKRARAAGIMRLAAALLLLATLLMTLSITGIQPPRGTDRHPGTETEVNQ